MFNPFPPYELKYLAGFQQKGVKAFVKQTYDRGRNMLEENPKPAFLLTHYTDLKMATNHLDAIAHDPGRQLLTMDHPADFRELQRLGEKGGPERVYMRFKVADAETKAKKFLDKKLHAYIDHTLRWRVPGSETVAFSLEFIFGDIYVQLRHGGRSHQVKIEAIETTNGYVL